MRLKWGWIWTGLLGIALLALIGWRVATRNKAQASPAGGQGGGMAASGGGGRGRGGPGGGSRMPPSVEVYTAKPADLVRSVSAVGNIESPQKVEITSRITGRIESLTAREGDPVKAGQVLVRIDPSDLQAAVLQQQAAVAQARSRLAEAQLGQSSTNVSVQSQIAQQRAGLASSNAELGQIQQTYNAQLATAQAGVANAEARLRSAQTGVQNAQAQVAQQQANLQNAQQRLARAQTLFAEGAISAQQRDDAMTAMEVQRQAVTVAEGQVDAARAAVEAAQAEVRAAQNNVSIVQRTNAANLTAAKAKVAQSKATLNVAQANRSQAPAYQQNLAALRASLQAAQAQYQAAQARLQDTVLRSPLNGAVTARGANPGEMASPGRSLLTVESLDSVYVTTAVPIEEASGVREGVMAQVTVDALPNQVFAGPISNVNPSADPASRQFGVRIRLANPGRTLKPGMYAKVGIITSRTHAAVAVPVEAVKKGREGTTATVIDKESVAHVVPIVTGATNGKLVEIVSGVRPGDKVVTLSFAPIKDEQKVTLPGAAPAGGTRGGGRSGRGSRGGRQQS